MLRLTVSTEEYLMLGDDIKIVFLGGTGKHLRIMIDAPQNVNIVRSSVIEKQFTDPEIRATLPKYYREEEPRRKYRKKMVITKGNADAVLAASLFHYKELEIREVKEYLREQGISVRL